MATKKKKKRIHGTVYNSEENGNFLGILFRLQVLAINKNSEEKWKYFVGRHETFGSAAQFIISSDLLHSAKFSHQFHVSPRLFTMSQQCERNEVAIVVFPPTFPK